ncbi:hypothetical protein L1049_026494 [Liquidambar formosana]|uniref:WWE domain-containing protein n=1 Tax=Liquidambar formosana TaxID=63359 RepID=A0AAP0NDU0_LIQFO
MDSKTMSHPQNQERRSITKTIRVKVPSKRPTSSSSSTANPRKQCNHPSSRHTQLLMQNHSNFKRSEAPTRIMFYEGGSWVDFPGEVVRYLRSEFSEGKPMVGASIDGSRYLFDFMRMLQTDFASGRERSIAWIDDNGKCFFPKLFVGSEDFAVENSEDAKIDIEIRINGDSISGNGKREMVEVEGDQNVVSSNNNEEISSKRRRAVTPGLEASRWQCPDNGEENSSKRQRVVTPGLEASRWPNAKPLKEGDGAYQLVKKHFLLGVRNVDPSATISSIYQCTRTGPLERARWEVFKKQTEITKAARGSANTIFAWYGTSAQGVVSIFNAWVWDA